MKLIHRLELGAFIRVLVFTIAGAVVLFCLIDLFDHLNPFLDHHTTLGVMGRYYLNKIPWIIDTVLPIGMLMATLFTVGTMARYNELTATFTAGMSLLQVTRPLLVLAAVAAVASFAWSEFVLPGANARVERIWEVEVYGNPDRVRPTNDVALYGDDGRLYYARTFVPERRTIREFRAVRFDDARLTERIDAQKAVWDGRQWVLSDGTRRYFSARGDSTIPFQEYASGLHGITPRTFRDDRVKPEAMNARQLHHYIEMIERSGGDATEQRVDLAFKFAFPAIHLVVVFLGILLASGPRKTTVASGFGWTIAVSFGYYLAINFGRALGHSGALPPLLAAWAGNLVFGTAALVLWLRLRR